MSGQQGVDLTTCIAADSRRSVNRTVAEELDECVICFEPLCMGNVAVLQVDGHRACRHLFHMCCAEACPLERGCPLCRARYTDVVPLPPVTSPKEWFCMMDVDSNQGLDQREALHAVAATVPVARNVLEAVLPALWASRQRAPDDILDFQELLGPGTGLLWELIQHPDCTKEHARQGASLIEPACPDLDEDKKAWFEHWDTNGSHVLEREEVVRGLAKGFRSDVPTQRCKKRLRMRCVVEELWPMADADSNGRISMFEFCRAGGLADLILERFKAKRESKRTNLSPRSPRMPPTPQGKSRRGSKPSVFPGPQSPRRVQSPNSRSGPGQGSPAHARGTDVECSVDEDKPHLLERPSLGFCRSQSGGLHDGEPSRESWSVVARLQSRKDSKGLPATPNGMKSAPVNRAMQQLPRPHPVNIGGVRSASAGREARQGRSSSSGPQAAVQGGYPNSSQSPWNTAPS